MLLSQTGAVRSRRAHVLPRLQQGARTCALRTRRLERTEPAFMGWQREESPLQELVQRPRAALDPTPILEWAARCSDRWLRLGCRLPQENRSCTHRRVGLPAAGRKTSSSNTPVLETDEVAERDDGHLDAPPPRQGVKRTRSRMACSLEVAPEAVNVMSGACGDDYASAASSSKGRSTASRRRGRDAGGVSRLERRQSRSAHGGGGAGISRANSRGPRDFRPGPRDPMPAFQSQA